MSEILLATENIWKAKLFTPILRQYDLDVITLNDIDHPDEPPNEDGSTVVENALIKARHYHSSEHPLVFADDTGLEIDALNGEPGVQTRRWGGRFDDDVDDQVWLDYLLERMRDVPPGERKAAFVDGWALIGPDGEEYTRELRARFEIAVEPLRPLVPDSPVMSVAIGLPQQPEEIFAAVKARWDQWDAANVLLRS